MRCSNSTLADIVALRECGNHTWQEIGEHAGMSWQAARGQWRRRGATVRPGLCPICRIRADESRVGFGDDDARPPDEEPASFTEDGNYGYAKACGPEIQCVEQLIEHCEVDLDVWAIRSSGFKVWEIGAKLKTGHLVWVDGKQSGEVHYQGLGKRDLWSVWAELVRREPVAIHPVVQPVECPVQYENPPRPSIEGMCRALVGSDQHIGFKWRHPGFRLIPFHDRRVLDVFLQVADYLQPGLIVWLGDICDNPEWTDKFARDPGFRGITQPALYETHWWARQLREACPDADIEFQPGNHSKRLTDYVAAHIPAAYELKAADDAIDAPALLDPRRLLGLDSLGIEWVGEYPSALSWLNAGLGMCHGEKASNVPGATARATVDAYDTSMIVGHGHSQESASRVVRVRDRVRVITAYCLGCMCRTDGTVPARTKRPNWQNGFARVDYDEAHHHVSLVRVDDGVAIVDGKRFVGRDRLPDLARDLPDWHW